MHTRQTDQPDGPDQPDDLTDLTNLIAHNGCDIATMLHLHLQYSMGLYRDIEQTRKGLFITGVNSIMEGHSINTNTNTNNSNTNHSHGDGDVLVGRYRQTEVFLSDYCTMLKSNTMGVGVGVGVELDSQSTYQFNEDTTSTSTTTTTTTSLTPSPSTVISNLMCDLQLLSTRFLIQCALPSVVSSTSSKKTGSGNSTQFNTIISYKHMQKCFKLYSQWVSVPESGSSGTIPGSNSGSSGTNSGSNNGSSGTNPLTINHFLAFTKSLVNSWPSSVETYEVYEDPNTLCQWLIDQLIINNINPNAPNTSSNSNTSNNNNSNSYINEEFLIQCVRLYAKAGRMSNDIDTKRDIMSDLIDFIKHHTRLPPQSKSSKSSKIVSDGTDGTDGTDGRDSRESYKNPLCTVCISPTIIKEVVKYCCMNGLITEAKHICNNITTIFPMYIPNNTNNTTNNTNNTNNTGSGTTGISSVLDMEVYEPLFYTYTMQMKNKLKRSGNGNGSSNTNSGTISGYKTNNSNSNSNSGFMNMAFYSDTDMDTDSGQGQGRSQGNNSNNSDSDNDHQDGEYSSHNTHNTHTAQLDVDPVYSSNMLYNDLNNAGLKITIPVMESLVLQLIYREVIVNQEIDGITDIGIGYGESVGSNMKRSHSNSHSRTIVDGVLEYYYRHGSTTLPGVAYFHTILDFYLYRRDRHEVNRLLTLLYPIFKKHYGQDRHDGRDGGVSNLLSRREIQLKLEYWGHVCDGEF